MDLILDLFDHFLLTPYVYSPDFPVEDWRRQTLSIYFILLLNSTLLYLLISGLSYYFIFDHRLMNHRLFLRHQVAWEIVYSLAAIPFLTLLSTPCFMLQVRGYTQLYTGIVGLGGWLALLPSAIGMFVFTDFCIYWLHRYLHHPLIYKHLHKTHHLWKVPTPFASYAFHPVDSFIQSSPYFAYVLVVPMHKVVFLVTFVMVMVWTVSIHDGDYRVPGWLEPYVNGSAHHSDHHLYYNYNYGQYFTLWDKVGGTFREPSMDLSYENRKTLGKARSKSN